MQIMRKAFKISQEKLEANCNNSNNQVWYNEVYFCTEQASIPIPLNDQFDIFKVLPAPCSFQCYFSAFTRNILLLGIVNIIMLHIYES